MPSGNMETSSEGRLFSAQIKVPLAFYLNLFGIMDTKNCPLTGNVNDLYIAYISQIYQISVFRCYGLCRAFLLDNTWDTEQCEGT